MSEDLLPTLLILHASPALNYAYCWFNRYIES